MPDYLSPDLQHSAVITIDVQNDFTLKGAPASIPGTLEAIPQMVEVLQEARARAVPIFHVVRLYHPSGENAELCRRQALKEGLSLVVPGSEGAELVSDLKPDPAVTLNPELLLKGGLQKIGAGEAFIYKPRWGAFYQTGLEQALTEKNINTLIFIGCNFPNCPRASIYQASERDFRIILVRDAISGLYPKGEEECANIGVHLVDVRQLCQDFVQVR